jgi:hypothetical protein
MPLDVQSPRKNNKCIIADKTLIITDPNIMEYNGQNLAVNNYGFLEMLRHYSFVVRKLLQIKKIPI